MPCSDYQTSGENAVVTQYLCTVLLTQSHTLTEFEHFRFYRQYGDRAVTTTFTIKPIFICALALSYVFGYVRVNMLVVVFS